MVGASVSEKMAEKRRLAAQKEQAHQDIAAEPGQKVFDFGALRQKWEEEAAAAKEGSLDATVTNLVMSTAGTVYGDKAKDPDREVVSMEITASDGKVFTETFSMPEGAGSWRNKAFKLGIFLAKYGKVPEIGMPVKVAFNDDGFYRLAM
jgi:hypothetical protein